MEQKQYNDQSLQNTYDDFLSIYTEGPYSEFVNSVQVNISIYPGKATHIKSLVTQLLTSIFWACHS